MPLSKFCASVGLRFKVGFLVSRRMRLLRRLVLGILAVTALTLAFAFWHPRSPLPDAWHPLRPLQIADPVTPLTQYKLNNALLSGEHCLAVLKTGAAFEVMEDLEASAQCYIRDRVKLRSVAGLEMSVLETRCQTALRLAMWAEHGIKPAAEEAFGQGVAQIAHNSSYNCRQMRTLSGGAGRMSTHATAESIDISGVVLADGRRLDLLSGWDAEDARGSFFRNIRDAACIWFRVTLGPEYNALHADHFHLQHTGWGLCR